MQEFMAGHPEMLPRLPHAEDFLAQLNDALDRIQEHAMEQALNTTGVAMHKKELRQEVEMRMLDTSRKLVAYAHFAGDTELKAEADYREWVVKRMRDTALRSAAQHVYRLAQTHLAALEAYFVTEASQVALQAAIDGFVALMPAPRLSVNGKKQSTAMLAQAFTDAAAAMTELDFLVEIVRVSDAEFYWEYRGIRKVVHYGVTRLAVMGVVADASDGLPVQGVALLIRRRRVKASPKGIVKKKSAEQGGFKIRNLPTGIYELRAAKSGYREQVVEFAVSSGERSAVWVEMVREALT